MTRTMKPIQITKRSNRLKMRFGQKLEIFWDPESGEWIRKTSGNFEIRVRLRNPVPKAQNPEKRAGKSSRFG